jgi:membrane protease YdiL (CAAX protease family)
MAIVLQSIFIGVMVLLAGTIPRNVLFFANLKFLPNIPWGVPLMALYLWFFWRYLRGIGPPDSTKEQRRTDLRANPLSLKVWAWSLIAGGHGVAALVIALRMINRIFPLPQQDASQLAGVPEVTVVPWLLMAALVAGVVEESAFRGYMQRPIERRFGLVVAILITGTMFALVHLDFTPVLWPYYVAVAAIYGTVAYLTNSILPAIVLHTAGNIYSNFTLWQTGRAEWQTASDSAPLIAETGLDPAFWTSAGTLAGVLAVAIGAYAALARVTQHTRLAAPAAAMAAGPPIDQGPG